MYGKNEEDFLKWNYEQCQTGYHSRDQMAIDIFDKMSQIFTFLIALIALLSLIHLQGINLKVYLIIVSIFGFISLCSLLLHLQSMVSCKTALRWGCKSIEEKLIKNYPGYEASQHWYLIDNRERQWIEKYAYYVSRILSQKNKVNEDRFERDGVTLVLSGSILVIIWVLLVLLTFLYSNHF